jgi:single-strand DNA-binding protein
MSYASINRVVLVGRLTRDPELRALPSGSALCSLRIACDSSRREPDGSYVRKPNFFSVRAFGGQAESIARYLHKGSRVAVDGRLDWSEWETDDGARRQAVDIVAARVEFLDRPDGGDGSVEQPGGEDPGEQPGRELVGVGSAVEDELVF